MAAPARDFSGRRVRKGGLAALVASSLVMAIAPATVIADQIALVDDDGARGRRTVVVLPFTICPSCTLPSVLAELQVDAGQIAHVHSALIKKLDTKVYRSATSGRATLLQRTGKPSRLDRVELYVGSALLAEAARTADGSYEIAVHRQRPEGQRPEGQRPEEEASRAKGRMPSGWGTKIETDSLDGSRIVTLALRSSGSLLEGTGDDLPGILAVRCLHGKISVVVSWPRFLGLRKGQYIQWKLDAAPWVTEYWAYSADGRAMTGPRSAAFLKQMQGAKELAVRATPYGLSPQTVTFTLAGLADAAAPLRKACHLE